MNVYLLQVFLTTAEELSFTAAAVRLNVSQPRVSLMVRNLEESLGFPLFHRTSRKVRLTPAGAHFLPAARAAWKAINDAREVARELAREGQVCVRLGAPYYTAAVTARSAVQKAFLAARPGARLEVTGGLTPELVRFLRAGEVEIVIAPRPVEDEAEFESAILAQADGMIGIPRGHPLEGRKQIGLGDLAGIDLICLPRRIGLERFNAWYRPASLAGARFVESPDMALAAMADMAIDLNLPMLALGYEGRREPDPRLIWRVIEGTEGYIDLVALRTRGQKPSLAAQGFWEAVLGQGSTITGPSAPANQSTTPPPNQAINSR